MRRDKTAFDFVSIRHDGARQDPPRRRDDEDDEWAAWGWLSYFWPNDRAREAAAPHPGEAGGSSGDRAAGPPFVEREPPFRGA